MTQRAIAAALFGSALALGGCVLVVAKDSGTTSFIAGEQFVHSWSLELDEDDLASHTALRITNPSGDVSVIPTKGPPRIGIDAYSADRDRARATDIKPRKASGGVLVIEPRWPGGIERNESCDIAVYVPVRTGIEIEVGAGEIDVEGMQGTLSADTGAGEIEIRSHDGAVILSTNAGDVEANNVTGGVEAKTSAGDIDLRNVGWPIEAVTRAGDIEVAMRHGFAGELRASSRTGDIDLPGTGTRTSSNGMSVATHTIGDASTGDTCFFQTSAGDIEVRVLPAQD